MATISHQGEGRPCAGARPEDGRGRRLRPASDAVALHAFRRGGSLSLEEDALIVRLMAYRSVVPEGRAFSRLGEAVSARVILTGWACRQRSFADGRRQIFGFLIPGDIVGLSGGARPLDEVVTVALGRVECVDAVLLREILATHDDRHARISSVLDRMRRREETRLLDQVVRLGRKTAQERTAHLLLELRDRCLAAGISHGQTFPMPLTQEVLADALGLSVVHLNRTLQQMKRDRLVRISGGVTAILDPERLAALAGSGD